MSKYSDWAKREAEQPDPPSGAVTLPSIDTGAQTMQELTAGDSKYAQMFKQETEQEKIDKTTGGSINERFLSSIKLTDLGKINFLATRHGQENVKMDKGGKILFRDNPQEPWIQFDESGLTWKDIADFGGEGIEMTPSLMALLFPGGASPPAQIIAATAGDVARQMLADWIPGDEGMSVQDRMKRTAFSAGLGAVTEFGGKGTVELINQMLNPGNIAKRYILKVTDPAAIQEGRRLVQETGVPLSPAQISLSRRAFLLEDYLRQNVTVADWMAESMKRQLHRAGQFFDKTIDKVTTMVPGKATAGKRAIDAYENMIRELRTARSKEGRKLFGEVQQLYDQDFIGLQNTVKEIDDIAQEMHTRVGTDPSNKVVEWLMNKRDEWADINLRPLELQRSLEIYGNASRGFGNVIKDLDDKAKQRMIAGRIFKALKQDLDDSISIMDGAIAQGVSPAPKEALEQLKNARTAWSESSEAIDLATDTILAKTLGYIDKHGAGGERFVENLFTNTWKPSEIRVAFQQLDKIDPNVSDGVRRAVLEEMIQRSAPAGGDLYEGIATKFSPQKMNTQLRNNRDRLNAMFYNRTDVLKDLYNMYGLTSRMITRMGSGRSPTFERGVTENFVVTILQGAKKLATGNYREVHSDLAKVMAPKTMARILMDKKGRQDLLKITRTKKVTRQTFALLSRLAGFGARDELIDLGRVIEERPVTKPAGFTNIVRP